ncbi:hypothetical protein PHLCEN_2v8619 [Hermanssonia centrifuga]|uniref:Glucose receptor Git3 N-terminal domain-containing protein n=1 Tax=Hermanssonia centrifuga TaxID=98765 RepID=A0A2R6NTV7_9APHY|nr:hypothetical protein PHLCEN_2v8619 [Hermanssonia centrifuga]
MRNNPSFIWRIVTICTGWSAVAFVVASGPLLVQSEAKGPYFGPSGYWCWITDNYPREQTFLEYFFEWLSAGFSFIIYIAILLRVRGNLVRGKDGWHIRYVPRSQRWQLAISRDWLDSTMMQVAARMVWYPVSYSILLIPISLSRLVEFGGGNVPFWATILSDTLFNLQGFVNAILLFTTHRLIPDPATLPAFSTRKAVDLSSSAALGITPFVLSPVPPSQTVSPPVARISNDFHDINLASPASFDSQTPLIREKD